MTTFPSPAFALAFTMCHHLFLFQVGGGPLASVFSHDSKGCSLCIWKGRIQFIARVNKRQGQPTSTKGKKETVQFNTGWCIRIGILLFSPLLTVAVVAGASTRTRVYYQPSFISPQTNQPPDNYPWFPPHAYLTNTKNTNDGNARFQLFVFFVLCVKCILLGVPKEALSPLKCRLHVHLNRCEDNGQKQACNEGLVYNEKLVRRFRLSITNIANKDTISSSTCILKIENSSFYLLFYCALLFNYRDTLTILYSKRPVMPVGVNSTCHVVEERVEDDTLLVKTRQGVTMDD